MAKGWKRFFVGEPMPDKNDPQYKDRYEREVAAGKKFAEWCRLPKIAAKIQLFGMNHKKAFLIIVFGIVLTLFIANVAQLALAFKQGTPKAVSVERVDSVMRNINRLN